MISRMLKIVGIAALAAAFSTGQALAKPKTEQLQILNVSDWHAQLDPITPSGSTTPVGGAAALSTYFERDRAAVPNTLTLTAGDAYGASPPLSGFFDEEPAGG